MSNVPEDAPEFVVQVTRKNKSPEVIENVVTFEPKDNAFFFGTRSGTRYLVPYGPDIYGIRIDPAETFDE